MDDERRIAEVFARYVRSTDARDGVAQGALYTDDAIVQIYSKTGPGTYDPIGEPVIGAAGVRYAVENYMAPHPPGASSHHVTADHLIEVDGDTAHFSAQVIVFEVRADPRPADGWPEGTIGQQGTVRSTESGYYDTDLVKIAGEWKISRHRVLLDLPMVLPKG